MEIKEFQKLKKDTEMEICHFIKNKIINLYNKSNVETSNVMVQTQNIQILGKNPYEPCVFC